MKEKQSQKSTVNCHSGQPTWGGAYPPIAVFEDELEQAGQTDRPEENDLESERESQGRYLSNCIVKKLQYGKKNPLSSNKSSHRSCN